MVQAVPYAITKVLTDNGVQFTQLPHRRSPVAHLFDAVCAAHGIEHRCTQVAHPWTNGQVERFNRTLKEASVQQYHYQNADELNAHLQTFLQAYNGGKRLKKLRGQTPYEFMCAQFAQNPGIFIRYPTHDFMGLYNYGCGRYYFTNAAIVIVGYEDVTASIARHADGIPKLRSCAGAVDEARRAIAG